MLQAAQEGLCGELDLMLPRILCTEMLAFLKKQTTGNDIIMTAV
jgi:hypothetical protein